MDSTHPIALSDLVKYTAHCSYPSTESDYNTSPFHGLHIAPQNENGIRYNLGHCRLDRLETAKTPFAPRIEASCPTGYSFFSKNLSGCTLMVSDHRVQLPLLIASSRGMAPAYRAIGYPNHTPHYRRYRRGSLPPFGHRTTSSATRSHEVLT